MKNSAHPNTDSLLRFVEKQDDVENTEISLHLASCAKCRTEVADLSSLSQQLLAYRPCSDSESHSENMPSATQLEKLQLMLAGDISPQQRDEFQQEMNDDKALLRASLHYASHSESMRKSIQENPRSQGQSSFSQNASTLLNNEKPSKSDSSISNIIKRCKTFLEWQPPLWSIAGVTAVLIVSVTINLQSFTTTPAGSSLIAYQDSPQISFISQNDSNPGMGFFNNIVTTSKPFTGVRIVETSQNTISITWPKVDNALRYEISLFQVVPNDRLLIEEKKLTANTAIFSTLPLQALRANTRFEWSLTGVTKDDKSFQAQGGFVKRSN